MIPNVVLGALALTVAYTVLYHFFLLPLKWHRQHILLNIERDFLLSRLSEREITLLFLADMLRGKL